jgi:hypothetical protein
LEQIFNDCPGAPPKSAQIAVAIPIILAPTNSSTSPGLIIALVAACIPTKAPAVMKKLESMKLAKAVRLVVADRITEAVEYIVFPSEHRRHIRTDNPLEQFMREILRRTRVVGNLPDVNSALMLVAARLRHVAGSRWGTKKYMNIDLLNDPCLQEATG